MEEQKIDAIFMEGGTSSYYFVGMRWGQSERTFGVVIPAKARSRMSVRGSRRTGPES